NICIALMIDLIGKIDILDDLIMNEIHEHELILVIMEQDNCYLMANTGCLVTGKLVHGFSVHSEGVDHEKAIYIYISWLIAVTDGSTIYRGNSNFTHMFIPS
ncbi:hypothetical protein ACJX0J_035917, partial [Zea mays]